MNFKRDTAATNFSLSARFFPLFFFEGGHARQHACPPSLRLEAFIWYIHSPSAARVQTISDLSDSELPSEDSFLILFIPNEHLNFSEPLSA